jgi:putative oxidoreductase
VLEPLAIASLVWLAPGPNAVPKLLRRVSRYLLAFALIIFGIAHFQALTFIASMVPGWIPWHWFWTVFFGVAFIAAGVNFATRFLRRWAALGVGLMFALWTVTIHLAPVLNFFRQLKTLTSGRTCSLSKRYGRGSWAIARSLRDRRDLSLGADSNRA